MVRHLPPRPSGRHWPSRLTSTSSTSGSSCDSDANPCVVGMQSIQQVHHCFCTIIAFVRPTCKVELSMQDLTGRLAVS